MPESADVSAMRCRRVRRKPLESVVVAGDVYGAVVPVFDFLQDPREYLPSRGGFQSEPYDPQPAAA